ncbi:MAG TPA: NAD-dependent epimerase/dehydratase family protein [Gemmatimonadaceae bacterium]|nr:NAD-dependent epimerase/dehydratase family protein [Gemmatimonadaceae bacterium]
MRVLVTGGTGVVGRATVDELLARGHDVRLFSRHAMDDVKEWAHRVEPYPGNVANEVEVRGAADGCEAVLHLTAIVAETPPDTTFETVNVGGTRNLVREAERAGVRRFVYVSSLGADHGESPYHKSKLRSEEVAKTFDGNCIIVRLGNVYGGGDEQLSLILRMVRSLPAVPVIAGGDKPFQPIWASDAGAALAIAAERDDLAGRELEVAGPEQTTYDDVVQRLAKITKRDPIRLPVPVPLASLALRAANALGAEVPVDSGQLKMLSEGNVVTSPDGNALMTVFGLAGTSLDDGLKLLADAQPEVLPEEGVGALMRKRFWADVDGSRMTPEGLFEHFISHFAECTPWHVDVAAEPGTPTVPALGETLTLKLPLRGNVQIRILELEERRMTLCTVSGHPLAGAVRFLSEQRGAKVRFEVQVYDRASNIADWIVMNPIGARLQDATWRETVERVVKESGGRAADGVEHESAKLDEAQATDVNEWLERLVTARHQEDREVRRDVRPGDRAPNESSKPYIEQREETRDASGA